MGTEFELPMYPTMPHMIFETEEWNAVCRGHSHSFPREKCNLKIVSRAIPAFFARSSQFSAVNPDGTSSSFVSSIDYEFLEFDLGH
jgi:hypothetical protein